MNKTLDVTALSIGIIGAVNWGLIGFFNFNLVQGMIQGIKNSPQFMVAIRPASRYLQAKIDLAAR